MTFIYFEMPKFNKTIEQLKTRFDKWLYVLKNLHKLDRLPDNLREGIFERVFEIAEIAKFTREEYISYEDSLKYYRDLKNSLETAKDEKAMEIALAMKKAGEPIEKISKLTGLVII